MKIDDSWKAQVNPWTPPEELLRVLALRGAVVWSFGHIEQKLTEVMIRSSYPDCYAGLRSSAPFVMKKRFAYLREVLDLPGPLSPYRSIGLLMIERIERVWPLRNMMAHADMDIGPMGPVRFQQIELANGLKTHWKPFYAGQLEEVAAKAGRLSRLCQRLMDRLEAKKLLPTFEEGEAAILERAARRLDSPPSV